MMQAYVDPDDKDEEKRQAAERFNWAMRGHYNTVETMSSFLVLSVVTGLFHPTTVAVLGGAYSYGIWMYGRNYSQYGPAKRYANGATLGRIAFFVLVLTSLGSAIQLVVPSITALDFLP
mmetsp:Transcript_12995/g.30817  ORF Transcript_12995/g.30817 Transcript_12995/m.30817 type:complete len:119 (+) Transcript_12995:203-559(+)